jgi:hypothetical protein
VEAPEVEDTEVEDPEVVQVEEVTDRSNFRFKINLRKSSFL